MLGVFNGSLHFHILVDSFLLFHSTRVIIRYQATGFSLQSKFVFPLCKTSIYFCASQLASHIRKSFFFSPFLFVFLSCGIFLKCQYNVGRKTKASHVAGFGATIDKIMLDLMVSALGIRKWCVYPV